MLLTASLLGFATLSESGKFDFELRGQSAIVYQFLSEGGNHIMKNNRLKDTAVKIGATAGRLDGRAHKAAQAAKAAHVAKLELAAVTKQLDALKMQLTKSSKRLQEALK